MDIDYMGLEDQLLEDDKVDVSCEKLESYEIH